MNEPGCQNKGKVRYKSEIEAITAALSVSMKKGRGMRVYRCCEHFHLTSRIG